MGVKRLLAATDFSRRSDRAVKRAASICRESSADLHLLHVVDDDQPADVVEQEVSQAETLLGREVEALRQSAGCEATTVVKKGDPFQEIVQTAAEVGADLIAMGAHRKRILRDVFVGTTIERVMRTGHHPVLMVNAEPSGPYRRIIVATDMSPASANALRSAKGLGMLEGAYVSLLYAFEPFAKGMMIYAGIEREKIEEQVVHEATEAKRNLTQFLSSLDLEGIRYDVRLEEGQTFYSIKKVVDKEKPNLLIIGTRGLTGTKRILLGSVADAVLRGVDCDVLAVPPQR